MPATFLETREHQDPGLQLFPPNAEGGGHSRRAARFLRHASTETPEPTSDLPLTVFPTATRLNVACALFSWQREIEHRVRGLRPARPKETDRPEGASGE